MKKEKGFTLVELMIVVVILGILAAIAIPAFIRYIRQSKTSEAKENLGYIYKGMVTYYQEEHSDSSGNIYTLQFPATTSGLPATVPKGSRTVVQGSDWDKDATFHAIRFSVTEPIYYKYSVPNSTASGTVGEGAKFSAQAEGDLDGDDTHSTFQRGAEVKGGEPVGSPLIEKDPTE